MTPVPVFGEPLFGESPPAPFAPLPGCDATNAVHDVWFRLGFKDHADMAVDDRWVTMPELYQYADDAVKFLARTTSIFLTYDESIAVTPGTPGYALPAGHVFTEGAWLVYAGGQVQFLRLTSVAQLFALDANWPTTSGDSRRLSMDARDTESCVLYPNPVAPATLAQVIEVVQPDVTAGASTLPLSPVLEAYFTAWMIAGALSKESDNARPEVAAHLRERLKLMDAVIAHLWGA